MSFSKNINPSLELVQSRKTRPIITERLLMVRKESNQMIIMTNYLRYLSTFEKTFDYIVHDILRFELVEIGVRGKMFNIIKSIYSNLNSREKFNNRVSSDFICCLGVRQGECLSRKLFSMYLNDIEKEYILKGAEGIDIWMLKLFLLCMLTT